jgi:hypothetical protein
MNEEKNTRLTASDHIGGVPSEIKKTRRKSFNLSTASASCVPGCRNVRARLESARGR